MTQEQIELMEGKVAEAKELTRRIQVLRKAKEEFSKGETVFLFSQNLWSHAYAGRVKQDAFNTPCTDRTEPTLRPRITVAMLAELDKYILELEDQLEKFTW